jgi:CheY-like chemotaxis protein
MKNQKKRILVVDDQADITRMLKLNLEQTNDYEVRMENNSRLALAAAEEFHPDLILLDVVMPGIDGGNLASRLEASPKLKGVPIVFLTAAATKEEVSARRGRIGGLPFLAKPVNTAEVVRCLKEYLG